MEFGSIEREIHVDATPEVVYEVVSTPEHLRGWWPDEAEFEPEPGGTGTFGFGDSSSPDRHVVALTVIEADPPRRFSFRWMHEQDQAATPGNSLLITFDLVPAGAGTLLRLTETGFREQGWEAAVLEEQYRDHVTGWDYYLPRLAPYVDGLVQAP
ncbi:SRPBCC domain-containing protein [Streptacidiphilus neutrinimicus]|uniref:SRPBCC domain-containing protein n=1 Tax=Streptacidiphilus neutrinimicus TaxID=105420 RepID=UPI0005A7B218|nr:SRPBCC domain-containing protein [Streptacidiphilus neutrinimicus]